MTGSLPGCTVSQSGDIWIMGSHRLLCGDARDDDAYSNCLRARRQNSSSPDPPYNVAIDGHVTGKAPSATASLSWPAAK